MSIATKPALELKWAFGMDTGFAQSVHLLESREQTQKIFYPISNCGVIHTYPTSEQSFLRIHRNVITNCVLSTDEKVLVTGDSGASEQSAIVAIWDAQTSELVAKHTLSPTEGIQALCLSCDNRYIGGIVNQVSDSNSADVTQYLVTFQRKPNTNDSSDEKTANDDNSECLVETQRSQIESKAKHNFVTFSSPNYSEIVTHSAKNIVFYKWNPENADEKITKNCPKVGFRSTQCVNVGNLTRSVFKPDTNGALLSGLTSGDIIVWDYSKKRDESQRLLAEQSSQQCRDVVKVIRLSRSSVNCVQILNNNILALASKDGSVRFFDFEFRVIGWMDGIDDEIVSMSFPSHIAAQLKANVDEFEVPKMIVATKDNNVVLINREKRLQYSGGDPSVPTQEIALTTSKSAPTCMCTHPQKSHLFVGTHKGAVEIWDHSFAKHIQTITPMANRSITHIQMDASGKWLGIVTDNGYLKVYSSKQYNESYFFRTQIMNSSFSGLQFSQCGNYLAVSQLNRISVHRYYHRNWDTDRPKEWILIGNYESHSSDIISLHFGEVSGLDPIYIRDIPRLFSVGLDKLIQEYDLETSSIQNGVVLKRSTKVTNQSTPTTCFFVPGIRLTEKNVKTFEANPQTLEATMVNGEYTITEDLLIVADDELKFHIFSCNREDKNKESSQDASLDESGNNKEATVTTESQCEVALESMAFRRTVLAPILTNPIKDIQRVKGDLYTFACFSHTIGLMEWPFDGLQCRYSTMDAHPSKIVSHCISNDRDFIISSGGLDEAILMWRVYPQSIRNQINTALSSANGNGKLNAFLSMLDDGIDGKMHTDVTNYFYYVQISQEGDIASKAHNISGRINFDQCVKIMQSMNCFLTKYDIDRLNNELKWRFNNENPLLSFEQFLQIFINYRPTFDISFEELKQSFQRLTDDSCDTVSRNGFIDTLRKKGEQMTREELLQCLVKLTGHSRKQLNSMLPQTINTHFFVRSILGFDF